MTDEPTTGAQNKSDEVDTTPEQAVHAWSESRLIRFSIGLILFIAACWAVAVHRDKFSDAFEASRHAMWWLVAAVLLLPLGNWLAVSASLTVLTRRFGKVDHTEMVALVGSAWLLNYLPMRPGLVARLAYHKKVNNIMVRHSMAVLALAMILTGVSSVALLLIALVLGPDADPLTASACVLAPVALGLVASLIARARSEYLAAIVLATTLRYTDMLIWTARYAAVFAIVGTTSTLPQAVAIAVVSHLALSVPFTGNGLGLREWAVGLTAGLLPAWFVGAGGDVDWKIGLAADLVNRAGELLVALPVGLLCSAWLLRHGRRHPGTASDQG